ncbi:Na+/H+ antiporter subunit E [Arthrobacter sp. JSM 101049]|uniref:Na+/H+ antiporter subunit E n=1 Tax=Arthrobacter sp. JSM 101049 TaxID=929097 RepID=UPI003566434D
MSPHRHHVRPARPSELLTGARGARARARRRRARFLIELPLTLWMVLVWGALWRDFSLGNLLFGFILSLAVVATFKLPPVELSGRFNVWHAVLFALRFMWQVVKASIHVMGVAIVRGPRVRNAVMGIRMRSHEDLMATALGHVLTLIPGSFVVEVDRTTSTLYLHVLDINGDEDAEGFRQEIRDIEAALIRVMGSREELAALRAEEASAAEATAQGTEKQP